MIPKKLDLYQLREMTDAYAVEKTIEKVNELIDYLQAKEEASKVTIKNNRKIVEVETEPSKLYWSGEASKGECRCICHTFTLPIKGDPTHSCCKSPEHEEELVGAIARGWCHTSTSNKVMDIELAKAIGNEVRHHINKFYVSKEKIKRVCEQVADKYSLGKVERNLIHKIMKSLELGD